MSQKNNIFSVKLIKKDGKLVHETTTEASSFKEFVNALEEGQSVETFFEAYMDTGTNLQLAKIHVCLKQMASDTGNSVEEIKKEVKRRTGLCWKSKEGEYCKSFGDCSTEELGLVIEDIKVLAFEMANIVFN
jgi:hypothetical protein